MSNATYQFGPSVSKVVKKLLIIQSLTALIIMIQHFMIRQGTLSPAYDLVRYFAITPELIPRHFYWQFVSYGFIHTEILSLLFNLLTLWMFGSELERRWGDRVFLRFYLGCTFGAGLALFAVQSLFHISGSIAMGAYGANMGMLLAYAIYWPDRQVWFFFLFPVRMKYVALMTGLIALYYAQASSLHDFSALGHLGGLITGAILMFILNSNSLWFTQPLNALTQWFKSVFKLRKNKSGKVIPLDGDNMSLQSMEKKVDELLEKISRHGMKSLSKHEVNFLRQASMHFDKQSNPTKH